MRIMALRAFALTYGLMHRILRIELGVTVVTEVGYILNRLKLMLRDRFMTESTFTGCNRAMHKLVLP
jgi:hypothetical protein